MTLRGLALVSAFLLIGVCWAAKDPENKRALPKTIPTPEYPAQLLADGIEGAVDIWFQVNDRGDVVDARVRKSSDPRFNDVCEAAVRTWKFHPALHFGERRGDERTIKIVFENGTIRIEVPKGESKNFVPAKVISQVSPDYPAELQKAGNDGRVEIEFVVDVNGVPTNPVVITSTHPAFEKPAIDALMKWRFKPAENDGKPIPLKMKVPLSFSLGGGRKVESFAVERRRSKGVPEELRVDVPPKPKTTVYAVHPYEDAVAGKGGSAEVKVLVGPEGTVIGTQVVKASSPDFGLALAFAMEAWTFDPPFKDGKRTVALIKRQHEFTTRDRDSAIDQKTASIASRIRKGRFEPASAANLEAPLKPRFTAAPVYPTALLSKGIEGIAKIEVIVDDDGRAVLPRIVEASEPEFGWAAATAAQRWRFEPPKVKGKPVEVKVMIPFKFTAPEPTPEEATPAGTAG